MSAKAALGPEPGCCPPETMPVATEPVTVSLGAELEAASTGRKRRLRHGTDDPRDRGYDTDTDDPSAADTARVMASRTWLKEGRRVPAASSM